MIRVLYFARLREDIGKDEEALALPHAGTTVTQLKAALRERGEGYARAFKKGQMVQVAINQTRANVDDVVQDGDEVAFFPPFTGG